MSSNTIIEQGTLCINHRAVGNQPNVSELFREDGENYENDMNFQIQRLGLEDKVFAMMLERGKNSEEKETPIRGLDGKEVSGNEEKVVVEEGRVGKLGVEIELLEMMMARGTIGLMDLQMMGVEIEALKELEEEEVEVLAKEMEMKVGELHEGLWELRRAVVELKCRKVKELMGCVEIEEEKLEQETVEKKGVKGL